jgi:hypothetical protein
VTRISSLPSFHPLLSFSPHRNIARPSQPPLFSLKLHFEEKNILTIPHEGLLKRDFFYKTVEEIEFELLEKIRQKN